MRQYRQRLAAAHALVHEENYAFAGPALDAVLGDPLFATLPVADRHSTLSAAAWTAIKRDDLAAALALYQRATALDDSDPEDWYRLYLIGLDQGQDTAASGALVRLAQGWPELLDKVDYPPIFQLIGRLSHDSPERLQLLQALFDAHWKGEKGDASASWYQLALVHLERGEIDAARVIASRITAPRELIKLRSDKRFDAIVDPTTWRFNVEQAAQRRLEAQQTRAALEPTNIDAQADLTFAMLTVGKHEETLALADKTLAAIADAPAGNTDYAELERQVWIMNSRAVALRRLGRFDDAVAELRRAREFTEMGGMNVSQALNLGDLYCKLGRGADALAAVASVGENMSGYGRMVLASVQHRAALLQHDAAAADKALAYLREHHDDSSSILLTELIYAERWDEAAGVLNQWLASPKERGDALYWLQDFRPSGHPLPADRERAGQSVLLARDDVKAALSRVGRVQRYDIFDLE
ncbi:hypothetical protein GCM10027432_06620 [Lysobacter fragariae]